MKISRHIQYMLLALVATIMAGCSEDDIIANIDGDSVDVMFHPSLDAEPQSRTIGKAERIDQVIVGVYENGSLRFSLSEDWAVAKNDGIKVSLIEGRTYQVLFWAQDSQNTAYTLSPDGNITVNYDDYTTGGFAKMEELDAFYFVDEVTVGAAKVENRPVVLSRPFAQLNFADKTTRPESGVHRAEITFANIPTAFNPVNGTITTASLSDPADDVTFSFSDFTQETLTVDNVDYYYLTSNYLFAPASESTIEATFNLLPVAGGNPIKSLEFKGSEAITLKANCKTNVLGSMVQQPVTWSVWDGSMPGSDHELATDSQNRYIVDEAADIAWLTENAEGLHPNRTFILTVDVDMNNFAIPSIDLPAGSTFDGNEHTIKNLQLSDALFGNATNLTVKNLTVEEADVANTATTVTHVGILVNTLKGNSSFTNVNINNSSVSTDTGAAGGIVGYISGTKANDTNEMLEVTFDNCHVTETIIDGETATGHFVGLLRGYDPNERLTFNSNCTLTLSATAAQANDFVSPYREGNEGTWLAANDYSKYDGWLGKEECYRGTVMLGGIRFIPCWDGTTKITPLTDGSTKLIYSPFDLANVQKSNPGTIKFMSDVDMGKKTFDPLTNLSKLIGEGKTIYNLKVETVFNTGSWDGGGFIRRCSAATIENITFQDADIKVTHASGSDGDAYASVVCGTAEGTNTFTNVKVIGGKLYGCNKMGGIAGYITGTFSATNCNVDGLSIENYDSGGKDSFGFKANGEVGGAFGFIAANATISGCYVKNTTLNCTGVNNGRALVLFKYAGRHVNEFIGDIRTTSGQTIRITYDEKNFTGNSYKNRKDQYSECKFIGHCYYTNINAIIAKIEDTKGTVYVNEKSITVAKNY